MTMERIDPLTHAIHLYKQGDTDDAEEVVKKYLMSHPHDLRAWLMLAKMTDDLQVKRRSLERVLAKDPYHKQAREMLNVLLDVMPNITEFSTETRVNAIESKKRAVIASQADEEKISRIEALLVWGMLGIATVIMVVVGLHVLSLNG